MRSNRGVWIILLLVVLAVCCLVASVGGLLLARNLQRGANWFWSGNNEVTATVARTLEVGDPANLEVDLPVGSLIVRTGEPGQMTVEATKRAWGRNAAEAQRALDRIEVSIEQTPAGVRVEVAGPDWQDGMSATPRTPQVDVVVTVPEQAQLDLRVGVGQLAVDGVRGDVHITADVGEVELTDVQPQAALEVESRVASIRFAGALTPGATYRMTSDVGRILLELPRESTFRIEARSDIGDATVDFDVVGQQERPGFTGKDISGQVGQDTGTELFLRSRVGDVRVQQRP
jgi:hypothetical protein